jgi:hypothetical protein
MRLLCRMGLHKDRAVYLRPDIEIPDNLSSVDRLTLTFLKKILTELQFWCDRCGKRVY